MNAFKMPFALLGFFGLVAVVPAWVWFVHSYPSVSSFSVEEKFLLDLMLPALIALYLASWLQPRS